MYDDATIFVSADHGEGFGEHQFYLHAHHFWEEVIHVPLLAKGPKFKPGTTDERLTDSIDVTKTIAELAGAEADEIGEIVAGALVPEIRKQGKVHQRLGAGKAPPQRGQLGLD